MSIPHVIFIDDEEDVRLSGKQTLELEGLDVVALASAEEALDHLSADWPGVVVTDIKMPRMSGLDLLARVQDIDPELPVVLITAHGDISMAINAIRDGAYDFIEKPAPPEYLIDVVRRAREKRLLVMENRALRRELSAQEGLAGRIIGESLIMAKLRETVANIAGADVDVLLIGETGTGKELVARCLHDLSRRREDRFVALNCGAIPETIIESELFGHEKGAFTGAHEKRIGKIEHAGGGTLFLDEIESMPLHLQVKLLRVIEERCVSRLGGNREIPVDIRIVAASKVNLLEASEKAAFREDLYYRLNVASIVLPPLRHHKEDIPLLFGRFVVEASAAHDRPVRALEQGKIDGLMARDWPGNVRELKNAAERFTLGLADLAPGQAGKGDVDGSLPLAEQSGRFEEQTIRQALKAHRGRIKDTAEALGLQRKTLYRRMLKYGLDKKDFR